MKKPIITALIALLLGTGLHARLGETVKELNERYGEPVERSEKHLTYRLHDFYISITLGDRDWGRVAVGLVYHKFDKDGDIQKIKSYEVKKLLDANFGRGNWKKQKSNDANLHVYDTKGALAVHDETRKYLSIGDDKHSINSIEEDMDKMNDF